MSKTLIAAFALTLLAAPAVAQDIPRVDPKACNIAQAEIKPLQPLSVVTPKGKTDFLVEVATTGKQTQYGMMCRKGVAPNRGMLFDMKKAQQLRFWMRNTIIPLDIIYIRDDGTVVSVAHNVRPLDESGVSSNGLARWVLELGGGRAAQLGLLPGDKVVYKAMVKK